MGQKTFNLENCTNVSISVTNMLKRNSKNVDFIKGKHGTMKTKVDRLEQNVVNVEGRFT